MKKILTIGNLKTIAALLLLSCLVLPFSSCTRYVGAEEKFVLHIKQNMPSTNIKPIIAYSYPYKMNMREPMAWLFIFCFLWPIPILIHRRISVHNKLKLIIWAAEPLFIIGSSAFIYYMANFFSKPSIGAYTAFVANATYGIAWLLEMRQKRRREGVSAKFRGQLP